MKSRFRSENRKNTLKSVKINRRTKKMKEFEQLCKEFEQLDVVSYTSILAKNQLKFCRFSARSLITVMTEWRFLHHTYLHP